MRTFAQALFFDKDNIHTLEKDSEFKICKDDFLAPRKLGISGHLRVKNEARSVGLAIESALPALDELIITCQKHIDRSGMDETYAICKDFAKKYPDKIKLFYYTPEVIAPNGSHVLNDSKEASKIKQKFLKNEKKRSLSSHIPANSVHSIAHYYNFGLTKTSYKYYIKIDGDHVYFTDKLLALRKNILKLDYLQTHRKSRLLGKFLEPFYAFLGSKLYLQKYLKFCMQINGKCAFSLSGLNIGKRAYETKVALSKEELLSDEIYIPLVQNKHDGFCVLNASDHVLLPIDPSVFYVLHDSGVENLRYGAKNILFLGLFSFHYGMEKRDKRINGIENIDYISLKNYLKTNQLDLLRLVKFDAKGHLHRHLFGNIKHFKHIDDLIIEQFLK
ncbi:MAG: hypothetical protein E7K04_05460 [Helicobacter sp.]|nr:hypothetical protein [Helicobacter sp.]